MKHALFEALGDRYPSQLEKGYDRVLTRIEALWHTPEIHGYFTDLLIDKRGGRKGFPKDVLDEIIFLRELRELETFRRAEQKEEAVQELRRRGIGLARRDFLRVLNEGDQELIDLFVRAAFNVNVVDDDGTPALLLALKRGYTVAAKILVNAGADANLRDRLGLSPLLVACGKATQGYQSIAEALIRKGAFINVRDSLGYTPLLLALSGGTADVARLLIRRGADVYATTRKGETALSLALQSQCAECVELVRRVLGEDAVQLEQA